MGGAVTIGRLMMASGDILDGRWESARAWRSGCACLDDSLGPEVLALLGGMRCTDGSGVEKSVVSVSHIYTEEG